MRDDELDSIESVHRIDPTPELVEIVKTLAGLLRELTNYVDAPIHRDLRDAVKAAERRAEELSEVYATSSL